MLIRVEPALMKEPYGITVQRGALTKAGELFDLDRKVLVVTDDGVPRRYCEAVADACRNPFIFTLEKGEGSKSLVCFSNVLSFMLDNRFTRSDAVVAVGGGVVGDLAGFAAACYMRGVDFYNVPTTLLAQADSSIGGKCAIDFGGVKNIVGQFKFPSAVLVDTDVLKTLEKREVSSGLAEVIKMAATCDADLFGFIESSKSLEDDVDAMITGALRIKSRVVSGDPFEKGLRKVLNFGHTVGHAIESLSEGRLLHGECVGLGMLLMSNGEAKERIRSVLAKYVLPTSAEFDVWKALDLMMSDKKSLGEEGIETVWVDEIGTFDFRRLDRDDLRRTIEKGFGR